MASWCLVKAGFAGGPLSGRAAVRNWARWADASGRVRSVPKRGDLFFWLNANGTGHIGFVTKADGVQFVTIEGNTNAGGSREGARMSGRKPHFPRAPGFLGEA